MNRDLMALFDRPISRMTSEERKAHNKAIEQAWKKEIAREVRELTIRKEHVM